MPVPKQASKKFQAIRSKIRTAQKLGMNVTGIYTNKTNVTALNTQLDKYIQKNKHTVEKPLDLQRRKVVKPKKK